MFWFRTAVSREQGGAEVAFTDATLDLQGRRRGFAADLGALEQECGVRFARLSQVHGDVVVLVDAPGPPAEAVVPVADAMLTTTPGVGLMVRAADCVPVVLLHADAGVAAVAHAGRGGMVLDVVTRVLEAMAEHGARAAGTTAWVGPHVCGGCYEVPAAMRDEVAARVPEAWATTRWGTPAVDVGAGVRAQLHRGGVEVVDVAGCTREEPGLPSYRRDGAASGRLGGLVWLT